MTKLSDDECKELFMDGLELFNTIRSIYQKGYLLGYLEGRSNGSVKPKKPKRRRKK